MGYKFSYWINSVIQCTLKKTYSSFYMWVSPGHGVSYFQPHNWISSRGCIKKARNLNEVIMASFALVIPKRLIVFTVCLQDWMIFLVSQTLKPTGQRGRPWSSPLNLPSDVSSGTLISSQWPFFSFLKRTE